MPLNTTEREGFRKFVSTLQPLFKMPSGDSTTQWIDDKYEFCKANLKKMLVEADHIVLTMDIWTQKYTMRSHLGVTVHFTKGKTDVYLLYFLYVQKLHLVKACPVT